MTLNDKRRKNINHYFDIQTDLIDSYACYVLFPRLPGSNWLSPMCPFRKIAQAFFAEFHVQYIREPGIEFQTISHLFLFSVPPSRLHLTSSSELPIVDGTLVSFNCTSERVYPNPIFEWYKNDKLIQRFVLFFLFWRKQTMFRFVSSIGNQTGLIFFSSSSILTLLLTPADHNHILRCQVSNEASIDQTYVDVKLDILC